MNSQLPMREKGCRLYLVEGFFLKVWICSGLTVVESLYQRL